MIFAGGGIVRRVVHPRGCGGGSAGGPQAASAAALAAGAAARALPPTLAAARPPRALLQLPFPGNDTLATTIHTCPHTYLSYSLSQNEPRECFN